MIGELLRCCAAPAGSVTRRPNERCNSCRVTPLVTDQRGASHCWINFLISKSASRESRLYQCPSAFISGSIGFLQ